MSSTRKIKHWITKRIFVLIFFFSFLSSFAQNSKGIVAVTFKNQAMLNPDSLLTYLRVRQIDYLKVRFDLRRRIESCHCALEEAKAIEYGLITSILDNLNKDSVKVILSVDGFPLDSTTKRNSKFDSNFWTNEDHLNAVAEYSKELFTTFESFESVWAYEIISEPVQRKAGQKTTRPSSWFDLFKQILNNLELHSSKKILFSPGPWAWPTNYSDFHDSLIINNPRVIFTAHVFYPRKLAKSRNNKSPSDDWDIKELENYILPFVNFLSDNDVKGIIGGYGISNFYDRQNELEEDWREVFDSNNLDVIRFNYNGAARWRF